MMTLRQIEVIRAMMVTGTIGGAAKLLNVSAPGISRLMKYTERTLGSDCSSAGVGATFRRRRPRSSSSRSTASTRRSTTYQFISHIGRGGEIELHVGSVPSISQVMVPRAIERRPEAIRTSHRHQHPEDRGGDRLSPARQGRERGDELPARPSRYRLHAAGSVGLLCIVPVAMSWRSVSSCRRPRLTCTPLIGIDPNDPYGRIMAEIFSRNRLSLRHPHQGALRNHRVCAGEGRARDRNDRPVYGGAWRLPRS